MSVIFIVLPVALAVVLVAVVAFLWAARRGQFDDLTTPAIRAIQDDRDATRDDDLTTPAIQAIQDDRDATRDRDAARPRRRGEAAGGDQKT